MNPSNFTTSPSLPIAKAEVEQATTRDKHTTNEMRFDWLANRWVIMAPQRTERPGDFVQPPVRIQDPDLCPFCCGKESETPDAVAAYPVDPGSNGVSNWSVRVVPNKFPAVSDDVQGAFKGDMQTAPSVTTGDARINLFARRSSQGGHEVIVESPQHLTSLTELDRTQVGYVFQAFVERLDHWLRKPEIEYAVVFKNVGQDAGASLAHTHSQLIATEILPSEVQRATERMQEFYTQENECVFCRMVQDELEQKERIVEETPDFIAFCPFASRLPSLINILPKSHASRFERQDAYEYGQLSWLMHRLTRRLEKCHPDSSYNFVIHTAPKSLKHEESFHWRIELFPRLTKIAGFEWGSDCFINPLTPEDAARNLRRAGL